MSGKNINFDDKKIKRSSFYKNKKIINIEDIDVNNILVSKKEPYGTKITNFLNKKMPKEKALCKSLSIIMIDSVIKANKKYYPQTLLEECKYMQEKMKIENYINEDLKDSKSDSDTNNETKSDIDNEK